MIKEFLKILFKTQKENAEAKQIAKHLSKVFLFELSGIEALYPDIRDKAQCLVKNMAALQMPVVITETFRSAKKQNELSFGVTQAKGLQSYHQYGLAFDVKFVNYGYNPPSFLWWDKLGAEGEKLGLEWGGRWTVLTDKCHFQWTANSTLHWSMFESYFKI